jgi:hypothetical protein
MFQQTLKLIKIVFFMCLCKEMMTVDPVLPVNLRQAGEFVILSKTAITNVPATKITGNIAVSPIAATAMTGFGLVADKTNTFSTSTQVVGRVYAADYSPPTPSGLTTAVGDMEDAYGDAFGRYKDASLNEKHDGLIVGQTLTPGVYT